MDGYTFVVTRYGARRHLSDTDSADLHHRHHTLCRGTSAWTLDAWQDSNDHPHLWLEELRSLPICEDCTDRARELNAIANRAAQKESSMPQAKKQNEWTDIEQWKKHTTFSDKIPSLYGDVKGVSLPELHTYHGLGSMPLLPSIKSIWVWQPGIPMAASVVAVTSVVWNGEEWYVLSEDLTGKVSHNSLSHFLQSAVYLADDESDWEGPDSLADMEARLQKGPVTPAEDVKDLLAERSELNQMLLQAGSDLYRLGNAYRVALSQHKAAEEANRALRNDLDNEIERRKSSEKELTHAQSVIGILLNRLGGRATITGKELRCLMHQEILSWHDAPHDEFELRVPIQARTTDEP